MSGHSGDCPCPRCGKTCETYDDWKPHTVTSGTCPYCGYYWYTEMKVLSDHERAEYRDEQNEIIGEELDWPPDDELDQIKIKEFDERFCPSKEAEMVSEAVQKIISKSPEEKTEAEKILEYLLTLLPSRHDYFPHDEEKYDNIKDAVDEMIEYIEKEFLGKALCISCKGAKSPTDSDWELCNSCYKEAMDGQEEVSSCPECGHNMIDHGTGETCEGCGHTDTN